MPHVVLALSATLVRADALPVAHVVSLSILRRDEKRLAPPQWRRVLARLDARVERIQPATRREADRKLVAQLVDRWIVLDRVERSRRASGRLLPQPRMQELRAGM